MSMIFGKFKYWARDNNDPIPLSTLISNYNNGFAGAYKDPEATERVYDYVLSNDGYRYGEDAAYDNDFVDSGKDQLIIPFIFHEQTFPGCWPGPAQQRGDCVSHSTKNAALLTLICEIISQNPDPVTRILEGVPDISPEAIKAGVLSTEAIYWWRRHGGDGWNCDHAAEVVMKESGLWLRKNYADLNIDLTNYSANIAGKYGSRTPPDNFKQIGQEHLIRTITELRSAEEIRDFLKSGFGISSCGGEGYQDNRNEDGVSKRSGSWPHAMAYIGFDDRPKIKQKYGEPLVLILNSWGSTWISGPTKILDTDIHIPPGSFWTPYSHCKNRYAIAVSNANGWKAKRLPDYGFTGLGA